MRMTYRENPLLKIREVILTFLAFLPLKYGNTLIVNAGHNVLHTLPQNIHKILSGYILTKANL